MNRRNTVLLLTVLMLVGGAATVQAQRSGWPQNPAVTPEPRAELAWWMPRFYDNVRQVRAGNVELLMIGDSITHWWERSGADVYAKYYAHRNAVNLGFSGDRTQHVIWRLINGELLGTSPKVAVVMIGTNNTSSDTPAEIAAGVAAITYTLRGLLPETKILLLATFPRGATADDWRRGVNESSNAMVAELADGEWIHYLDIGDAFLDANGDLPESIMPDGLHPNELGYQIWAEAMEPTLARLLGDTPIR